MSWWANSTNAWCDFAMLSSRHNVSRNLSTSARCMRLALSFAYFISTSAHLKVFDTSIVAL
eukprot:3156794-Pyramimonas_sp.AAC.1